MLVMNESFDCWHKGKNGADYHLLFSQWWQRDLSSMVLRDRNHPSVFCWSIGNEIPGCFDTKGIAITKLLAAEVRRLDSTRPVTEAINRNPKANEQAAADQVYAALDIGGYNYNIDRHVQHHEKFPNRIMVVTESVPGDVFTTWEHVQDHAYILGDFVWTAMDYLGESAIGRADTDQLKHDHGLDEFFPWHGACCGDLDIIGDRRSISHYRNIVWDRGEKLFLTIRQPLAENQKMDVTRWGVYPSFANWTWPGFENKPVQAEIYSRCETVQLWLNDTLIGEKQTSRATEYMAKFDLQYQPGILRAVGFIGGKKASEQTIVTAGPAAAIRVHADRTTLQADGQDLSFVTVELVDKFGQLVMGGDREIRFSVAGVGAIAGVGNGDMKSLEGYQGTKRKTFLGRAMLVIRSTHVTGNVGISACADGLPETSIKLETIRPPQRLIAP
jgi:beta-galactosidase